MAAKGSVMVTKRYMSSQNTRLRSETRVREKEGELCERGGHGRAEMEDVLGALGGSHAEGCDVDGQH